MVTRIQGFGNQAFAIGERYREHYSRIPPRAERHAARRLAVTDACRCE